MKKFYYLFLAFATMLAVTSSCNGKSNGELPEECETSAELTPDGVSGESADLISIKEGKYTLNFSNSYKNEDDKYGKQDFSIKVKVVLNKPFEETTNIDSVYFHGCKLALLDKNGKALTQLELGQGILDSDTKDEFKKFLMSEAGTEKEFLFSTNMSNATHAVECFEKAASFKIVELKIEKIPSYEGYVSTSDDSSDAATESDSEDVSANNSSSDSEDWDALLNSYEQYVNKYISLVKKASNGDMSAMAEYPALLEKAEDISSRLDDAKGDMSASQKARYLKITNKMAKAAQQMH